MNRDGERKGMAVNVTKEEEVSKRPRVKRKARLDEPARWPHSNKKKIIPSIRNRRPATGESESQDEKSWRLLLREGT